MAVSVARLSVIVRAAADAARRAIGSAPARVARAVAVVSAAIVATSAALPSSAASPAAPAAMTTSRNAPAATTDPALDITFALDAAHRLTVRYRAPASVTHVDFMSHDVRFDRLVRTPMWKAADDCGTLAAGGVDLRHGPGCADGALFVVQPRTLGEWALSEPAQPSSDGGVVFYTGYYAAAARGLDVRWHFVPSRGDYGIDDGRRHDEPWTVAPRTPPEGKPPAGLERDSDAWMKQLHALNYVYLGHSPLQATDGVLWVRDPALPPAVVDAVAEGARAAWQAYADASGTVPAGPTAIILLRAQGGHAFGGFQGDRREGRMLRLSFFDPPAVPTEHEREQWRGFIAHEIAHLWNHGVFSSDDEQPWIHEGDAEWVSLNALHEARLLPDAAFIDRIESAVNTCLLVRGQASTAGMALDWRGHDDPYACGIALQLLGWTQLHARSLDETPLRAWGELHRTDLDAAAFAHFFDADGKPVMHHLLLDADAPFAPTYLAALRSHVLLQTPVGEPGTPGLREALAMHLLDLVNRADCGSTGYSVFADRGEAVLDDNLRCRSLIAGAHLTTVAGEPVLAHPRAAWVAMQRECADTERVQIGFADRPGVRAACPVDMPAAPSWVRLPADALRRMGLMPRPVYASTGPSSPSSSPTPEPMRAPDPSSAPTSMPLARMSAAASASQ